METLVSCNCNVSKLLKHHFYSAKNPAIVSKSLVILPRLLLWFTEYPKTVITQFCRNLTSLMSPASLSVKVAEIKRYKKCFLFDFFFFFFIVEIWATRLPCKVMHSKNRAGEEKFLIKVPANVSLQKRKDNVKCTRPACLTGGASKRTQ